MQDKYEHLRGHNNFENSVYDEKMNYAIQNQKKFWEEQAKDVHWFKPCTKIVDDSDIRFPKWFPEGEINISYNCIDRHIKEGRGEEPAFHTVSVYTGAEATYTYN